jgi:hypothetical protein
MKMLKGLFKINRPDSVGAKGGVMKKSLLFLVAVAFSVVLFSGRVFAATTGTAEITLRCTTTLSVTLVANSTSFFFGDLSAAATSYSTSPITFRNDSVGAICKWDLNVDNASLNSWTLGTQPGLNQVALAGVFKKSGQPADSDFNMVADSFSVTAKEYSGSSYFNADYDSDGMNSDATKILPFGYAGTGADRNLWLKIKTPLVVTDQTTRIIRITATAKLAG